ncbi:hypothetical protein PTSG_02271 [Salpingoeca rosetta]|uniref:BUD13 homolog n=1 Tax=Salpingoeca rosetta (strain ATCC 50818 / BSB-021) TaxID=946362 RepID=F2U1Q3_SALR5|nr:uncharacterized protein PTSG_02271 [Salpingoeca rosetta]EGD81555.1 hypothetical protein PTSG_02271 [Salpingoeca rosetta]|eukprot:XP_004996759.1 hypothetical protein PTSG_02271 [Salpingoeca rosetta]
MSSSSMAEYLAARYGPVASSGSGGGAGGGGAGAGKEDRKRKKRRRKKDKGKQEQRLKIVVDDGDAIPTNDSDPDMAALDAEDRPMVVGMDETADVTAEVAPDTTRKAASKWKPALEQDDDDLDMPRRGRRVAAAEMDMSPPRRRRHDSDDDASPPRRRRHDSDSDASPPRRRRHDSDSDASPPRRRRHDSDSDASPPRRAAGGDISPPRRPADRDLSPPRQSAPVETIHRTADGRRMDPKLERLKKRQAEEELLQKQLKHMEWGRGLAQTDAARKKREEDAYEASRPLARTKDDEDYNKELQSRIHADDPMAAYMMKKKEKEARASGRPLRPTYRGPAPDPNRFGIMPGHRWDGHDRSNGFERKLVASQGKRRARAEEAYKWSTENM